MAGAALVVYRRSPAIRIEKTSDFRIPEWDDDVEREMEYVFAIARYPHGQRRHHVKSPGRRP